MSRRFPRSVVVLLAAFALATLAYLRRYLDHRDTTRIGLVSHLPAQGRGDAKPPGAAPGELRDPNVYGPVWDEKNSPYGTNEKPR